MKIVGRVSFLAATLLTCSSCAVFLPSQPDALPVGLGKDGDVLVVYLPLCAMAEVDRVEIAPRIDGGFDLDQSHWWIADGYLGDSTDGIRLEPASWRSFRESFPDLSRGFSVDIQVGKISAGTMIYQDEVPMLDSLGSKLFAEGEVMSKREFVEDFGEKGC